MGVFHCSIRFNHFNCGIRYTQRVMVSLFVWLFRLDFHVPKRSHFVLSCSSSCTPQYGSKVIVSFDKIRRDSHNAVKTISKRQSVAIKKADNIKFLRITINNYIVFLLLSFTRFLFSYKNT
jgi:hypothetical protein